MLVTQRLPSIQEPVFSLKFETGSYFLKSMKKTFCTVCSPWSATFPNILKISCRKKLGKNECI